MGVAICIATKLFLERRGVEAEVFFNFNLKTKNGEFAEKDARYADAMVALLARYGIGRGERESSGLREA
jgi:hypothetical protein